MHRFIRNKFRLHLVVIVAAVSSAGCMSTMPKLGGGGGNTVTGAAAGSTAEGNNSSLESCKEPLGTIRVFEDQKLGWWREYRKHYPNLGSTLPVIRMMIQQSNCFVVVERGKAMNAMTEERRLMSSGELRGGSNFGKGQMVAADYTLSPSVQFSQEGSSGMSGVLNMAISKGSSLLGGAGSFLRGGGKVKSNESSTTLLLIDNRSGVQVSSSVGSAKNFDFSLFGMSMNNGGFANVSGFSNTPEGKVIIAAFADSYNQMVKALRNYKPQAVKGGLGKGGQLQVGGEDDQVSATPVVSAPQAPTIAAPVAVAAKQPDAIVNVRQNTNFNVDVDAYDEGAFNEYYDGLKQLIKLMPSLAMAQEGEKGMFRLNNMDLKSQLWVVWSTHSSQVETAKMELEFWPVSAKKQVWSTLGKRINKYNKQFNKHRKEIVSNEQIDERVRTSVANFELVTEESLFAE